MFDSWLAAGGGVLVCVGLLAWGAAQLRAVSKQWRIRAIVTTAVLALSAVRIFERGDSVPARVVIFTLVVSACILGLIALMKLGAGRTANEGRL